MSLLVTPRDGFRGMQQRRVPHIPQRRPVPGRVGADVEVSLPSPVGQRSPGRAQERRPVRVITNGVVTHPVTGHW
jgi:hypothetical protein